MLTSNFISRHDLFLDPLKTQKKNKILLIFSGGMDSEMDINI